MLPVGCIGRRAGLELAAYTLAPAICFADTVSIHALRTLLSRVTPDSHPERNLAMTERSVPMHPRSRTSVLRISERWPESVSLPSEYMSFRYFLAPAICVFVNVLDGFDILLMSVAAPSIGAALRLSTGQVGLVFSSGLAGMMFGAFLLAPLADRFGRRALMMACLAISIVGTFGTASSDDATQLLFFRFVTGLGVGGMMPIANTAIAEFVRQEHRAIAVTIQAAAYPMGGLLAALLWPAMIGHNPWHRIIGLACLPSVLCLALVVFWLPESGDFLAERARRAAIKFDASVRKSLIALATTLFLAQFSFYFFLSWIPIVLTAPLKTEGVSISGAVLLNLGGIAGDFVFAALTMRFSTLRLTIVVLLLAFLSCAALGTNSASALAVVTLATLAGAALYAVMAGIYSVAPSVFPTLSRASGTGIAFSVGRLGGALSPWLGALLLQSPSVSLQLTLLLMAIPLVIAVASFRLLRAQSSH